MYIHCRMEKLDCSGCCEASHVKWNSPILAGTLKVNVSVLLLSLASPDESSLVSLCETSKRSLEHFSLNFLLSFHSMRVYSECAEIRSGIFAPTAVVRSETKLCESIIIRLSQCNTSQRRNVAARHVLYHAWWFQR